MNHRGPSAAEIGYGCLVVAILAVVVALGLAVVFLWDVNQPHP